MDDIAVASPTARNRTVVLFVLSAVVLLLALTADELPIVSELRRGSFIGDLMFLSALGLALYAVGRVGALLVSTRDE